MTPRQQQSVEEVLQRWEQLGAARDPVLCIAPIGLLLASSLPLWFLAWALGRALDIPDNAPVIEQPYGIVWLVLMLLAMCVFMFIGFAIGTICNVLIARCVFGWPWAAIAEAGIGPALNTLIHPPEPSPYGDAMEAE